MMLRRTLLKVGGTAAATAIVPLSNAQTSLSRGSGYAAELSFLYGPDVDTFTSAFDKAYLFLEAMMDQYAQGATLRLIQSYSDQSGLQSTAFTYDNALAILAYLTRNHAYDRSRAAVLGDSLLYAQTNDSFHDGRLRQAYFVNAADSNGAFIQPAGSPFNFFGSSVGDLAWTGLALTHLYRVFRKSTYLNGALSIAHWIVTNASDQRGAGGFTAGVDASNNKLTYKATEHNIDTYSFFTMLARLSGDSNWATQATSAYNFIVSMWNSTGGFFWTGTGNDGTTINTANIPEDVQTWSYLALFNNTYAPSIEWAKTNLATIDTPQSINSKLTGNTSIEGVTFASTSLRALTPSQSYDQNPDPNAVWLEGTGHLVAALFFRRLAAAEDLPGFFGDLTTAREAIFNIIAAQKQLGSSPQQSVGGSPLTADQGIVAATSPLNTGFGSSYYPNLHIGATSWFLLAGQAANPFRFGYFER